MKLFVEKIEGRERDRRLLHAEVPLDVLVAAAHRQAARFDHAGHPGGRRFVIEEKLLWIAVDPTPQQTRCNDQMERDGAPERERNGNHDRDPDSALAHQGYPPQGRCQSGSEIMRSCIASKKEET